jgi:hypothetical protein
MDANLERLPTFLLGITLFKQAIPCLKSIYSFRALFQRMEGSWLNTCSGCERMQSIGHAVWAQTHGDRKTDNAMHMPNQAEPLKNLPLGFRKDPLVSSPSWVALLSLAESCRAALASAVVAARRIYRQAKWNPNSPVGRGLPPLVQNCTHKNDDHHARFHTVGQMATIRRKISLNMASLWYFLLLYIVHAWSDGLDTIRYTQLVSRCVCSSIRWSVSCVCGLSYVCVSINKIKIHRSWS